jgi:hypothetical protein
MVNRTEMVQAHRNRERTKLHLNSAFPVMKTAARRQLELDILLLATETILRVICNKDWYITTDYRM